MSKYIYHHSSAESSVAPIKIFENDDHQADPNTIKVPNTYNSQRKTKGGWRAAIFVVSVEVAEQFAYIGLVGNLIMYLTDILHEPTASAAKHVNTFAGVSAIFPLIGAFVADSLLGRFRTILLASTVYFLGMVVLTLSVAVVPVDYRRAVFYTALYIVAVGEGEHKPCVQTFAADQFDEETEEERRVKSSFFNWWYLGLVVGSTLAVFGILYVQSNISWGIAYAVIAGVLAVALAIFLMGIKRYRRQLPLGSPFTTVAQVLVSAARKWRVDYKNSALRVYHGDQQTETKTLAHTDQLRILDKAMIMDNVDKSNETRNPWRLCTLTQVEEVKLVLRLIPIWLSCLMFNVVQAQLHTFFTKQGSTMIRPTKFPPASLQGIVGVTILFTVLAYDRVLVPIARKITGHPSGITVLQRIGVGLFLSILNMSVSAIVEAKRVGIARDHNLLDTPKQIVPMRIWWLLPQYMICGFSDAFAIVGLQELFYSQMPDTMRSLGSAAYICTVGVGNFISTGIISAVQAISLARGNQWLDNNINRAYIDKFYWVLAGLSTLNLFVFMGISSRFVYKKVEVTIEKELDLTGDERI